MEEGRLVDGQVAEGCCARSVCVIWGELCSCPCVTVTVVPPAVASVLRGLVGGAGSSKAPLLSSGQGDGVGHHRQTRQCRDLGYLSRSFQGQAHAADPSASPDERGR